VFFRQQGHRGRVEGRGQNGGQRPITMRFRKPEVRLRPRT
jgi:hypothetical protein